MVIVPRQFGQVLTDAMNGLVGVWRTLLVPAVIVSVPVSIITIFAFSVTGGAEFLEIALNRPQQFQGMAREVFWALAGKFYLAVAIASLLQLIAGVFVALASHTAVAAQMSGSPISSGEAARRALKRYLTGIAATLLVIVSISLLIAMGVYVWLVPARSVGVPNTTSVFVAVLLLVVVLGPGVWAGVSASMTTTAVAIERRGVLSSIRRSMNLVRGRWWPTAGFLTLVGLLGGIAIQLIQLVALPMVALGGGSGALGLVSALGVFTQGLLVAAIASMCTHWYIDLRARKEGLSTESLT